MAELECSFCGKSQKEVKKLIAGPTVYICDECVGLCNDILEEDAKERGQAPREANPHSVLARFSLIVGNLHEIGEILQRKCASTGVEAASLPGLTERVESLERAAREVWTAALELMPRNPDAL